LPFGLTTANQTLIIGKKQDIAKKKMQLSHWRKIADAIRRGGQTHPKKIKKISFFS